MVQWAGAAFKSEPLVVARVKKWWTRIRFVGPDVHARKTPVAAVQLGSGEDPENRRITMADKGRMS